VKGTLLFVLTRREVPVLLTHLPPDLVARPFGVHNCAPSMEALAGPPGDQVGGTLVSVTVRIMYVDSVFIAFGLLGCTPTRV
jgi:hypothetical protein